MDAVAQRSAPAARYVLDMAMNAIKNGLSD